MSIAPCEPSQAISAPAAGDDQRRHGLSKRLWKAARLVLALGMAMGMWWLVWSFIAGPPSWVHTLFLPWLILLVIGLFMARIDWHWTRPTRRLAELIDQIRNGQAPIDELSTLTGGPAALVPSIRRILRDLKQQKMEMAELDAEMSQRVATRTSALQRQIGSLRQQATHDALTGLFNRRMFDIMLPQCMSQCAAEGRDLSLLMIDVDNFKLLNDTMGHAAGDELLRDIGQIIRSGIRATDAAFRVGGDEFVVLLAGSKPEQTLGLAARLADLVERLGRPLRLERPIGLSIGTASVSESPGQSAQELIARADRRVYQVKSSRPHIRRAESIGGT